MELHRLYDQAPTPKRYSIEHAIEWDLTEERDIDDTRSKRALTIAQANAAFLAKLTQALHESGALSDETILGLLDRNFERAA